MRIPLPLAAVVFGLACLPLTAQAQNAPVPQHTEAYALDSGIHAGQGTESAIAYSRVVEVDGAPWLRLEFSDAHLGQESYLTVTSLYDGAQQRLDAEGLAQWYSSSAYFNGDAVRVELHVAPGDTGVFVRMDELVVGEHGAPESQCGPTDDRIASDDPIVGRMMYNGCTGWLIHDNKLVSAGHCMSGGTVMQFNVPLSLPSGTVQHPGPEDQYSIDAASRVFVNGGVGNDFGVFRVFDNTQTGLQPEDAQGGGHFFVEQNLTPPVIRITGYGVDSGTSNQTQQTHFGPNMGSSGTTMRYQVDTTGGNSGSPVIDEATGHAVGVHTHGGCNTGGNPGNNSGTSLFHAAFWSAVGTPPPACEQSLAATLDDDTPAPGQTITYTVTIANNAASSATLDLWLVAERNGSQVQRTRLASGSLPAGATVTRTVPVRVPAGAPAGAYDVALNIGDFAADDICDTASFALTVSAPLTGAQADASAQFEADASGFFAAEATTAGRTVAVVPNPFSTQAQIRYTVSATADVRLAVYDVLGREVAVLVDGRVEAGSHAAPFVARDLAAGTYVYRLAVGDEVETGRLTLTR